MTPFEFEMHVPNYLKNRLNLKHNTYNAYINAEVDKLVDQLDAERAKYRIAPYPMEILDASSDDWVPIETKKIEVSIFGIKELLNGREILDLPYTFIK